MKFTQQRRVRLAQGLWLLSWLAVMCGTFIFCLGVYLKTELLRRAEVENTTNTNLQAFLTVPTKDFICVTAYFPTKHFAPDGRRSGRWRLWPPQDSAVIQAQQSLGCSVITDWFFSGCRVDALVPRGAAQESCLLQAHILRFLSMSNEGTSFP